MAERRWPGAVGRGLRKGDGEKKCARVTRDFFFSFFFFRSNVSPLGVFFAPLRLDDVVVFAVESPFPRNRNTHAFTGAARHTGVSMASETAVKIARLLATGARRWRLERKRTIRSATRAPRTETGGDDFFPPRNKGGGERGGRGGRPPWPPFLRISEVNAAAASRHRPLR